jgi:hypothetical protein
MNFWIDKKRDVPDNRLNNWLHHVITSVPSFLVANVKIPQKHYISREMPFINYDCTKFDNKMLQRK